MCTNKKSESFYTAILPKLIFFFKKTFVTVRYFRQLFVLAACAASLLSPALADVSLVVPNPDLQYHIQTDQGNDRFFRFQTLR